MLKYYFKLIEHHKEVFGSEEPCSFNELLFMVEAPQHLSNVDIWKYSTLCSLEDFPKYIRSPEFKLNKEEVDVYPFHELLFCIFRGDYLFPLIFLKVDNEFKCIEGKHRLRLVSLCHELNIEVPKFPVIKVEHVETRETTRYPEKYEEWLDYMRANSIRTKAKLTKKTIEGMIKWD